MSDGVPQFATAEYSGKPGTPSCKSCGQTISGAYYRVNAALTCATCAQRIKDQMPKDSHSAFVRGVLFGVGGALSKTERIILSAAAVLFAAYFRQPVFLLVAAGAGYRVFSKDIPLEPSHAVTAYYLMVLAALGYVISLAPLPPSGG